MSAMLLNCRVRFGSATSVAVKGIAVTGPNTNSRIAAATVALIAACDGYSGCSGVAFNDVHAGSTLGGVVAVLVAVADRGDGPPHKIGVLRIPVEDVVVGERHVEQREQARAFGKRELLRGRQLARHLLPCGAEIGIAPERHRVGLIRGPCGAYGAAQRLHLIVVADISRARQLRRWLGPELVGLRDDPWFCARVLLEERRRGRHVDARAGGRPVGVRRVGAVIGAVGHDGSGHLLAKRNALAQGRPFGDALQRRHVGRLYFLFLFRVELNQDLPCRGRRRRLGRRARHERYCRDDARVAGLHRIDRVGHCDMHHGQVARARIVADVLSCHDRVRGHVPVGDDIGACGRNQQRSRDYAWQ